MIALCLGASCTPPASAPTKTSEYVEEVAGSERFDAVIGAGGLVMVDFYADWCGPCRALKPTLHAIAKAYVGRVKVLAVNVDEHTDLAARFGIRSIPDVRVFAGGAEKKSFIGLRDQEAYTAVLDALLAQVIVAPAAPSPGGGAGGDGGQTR